jgi:hypothetical protein
MTYSARKALRGYVYVAVALFAVFAYAPDAWSRAPKPARCETMTEPRAKALFDEWNNALQVKPTDPSKVVLTYAPRAILLPTVENGALIGRDKIRGYFLHFL